MAAFLKNLADKAKAHIDSVKNNVSKQDVMDLFTDVQKSYSSDDTIGASLKIIKGLSQIASGKFEGASRQLETVYKDPSDIRMAEEIKEEFNGQLKEMLNVRKFLAGPPEVLDKAAYNIVASRSFINSYKEHQEYFNKLCEYFDKENIHYDRQAFECEIKRFISQKDVQFIISTRDSVDKYVFIDRMSYDEILRMPAQLLAKTSEI